MITDHMINQVKDALSNVGPKTQMDFGFQENRQTGKFDVFILAQPDEIGRSIGEAATRHVITPACETADEATVQANMVKELAANFLQGRGNDVYEK